jgi:anaerobic ribonucleoside-triphosphate reductase activating protein
VTPGLAFAPSGESATLRVARTSERCGVLGPGTRFVVWVQGCPLACAGCVAVETWDPHGGEAVEVEALAHRITSLPAVDGLTLSGGEPFAQAAALVRLADLVRAARPLSLMAFSGYTLEWLRRRGSPAQRALLDRLDILIDGPYRADLHADLRWRGSSNQRIHYLTPRHAQLAGIDDRGVGMEVEVGSDGSVHWMGVPPLPGFRKAFERTLRGRGVILAPPDLHE